MKIKILTFLLLILLCLSACKTETEISGEVFIVTQGAGNYKLGLVEIGVVPEDKMNAFINSLKNDAEISAAKNEYEKAKQLYLSSQKVFDSSLDKQDKQTAELKEITDNSESLEELNRGFSKINDLSWSRKEVEQNKILVDKNLTSMVDAKQKLNGLSTPERYFNGLPPFTVKSITNSDGKFSIKLPNKGNYALVARASRKTGETDEFYYWIVKVVVDGNPQNILLSNQNNTFSDSTDSMVKTYKYE